MSGKHLLSVTLLFVGVITGCESTPAPKRKPPEKPDAAGLVARHQSKDTTVVEASQRIDTVVESTELAEPVRVETDQIRAAVAQAPAREVADVAHAFSRLIDSQETQINQLSRKLDSERQRGFREDKRWLYSAGGGLLLTFALSLVFSPQAAARTWPLAILGGSAIGLAQVVGHPWFEAGIIALIGTIAAYTAYWVIKRHHAEQTTKREHKRAEAFADLVPVLDQAYEDANEDVRRILDRNIFDKLSGIFTPDKKAEVHAVRLDRVQQQPHG